MDYFWILALYMGLGTIWGAYGAYRFDYASLKRTERLCSTVSIGLNCMIFPLGMLMKKLIYIVRVEDSTETEVAQGMGIIIETLYHLKSGGETVSMDG